MAHLGSQDTTHTTTLNENAKTTPAPTVNAKTPAPTVNAKTRPASNVDAKRQAAMKLPSVSD